MALQEPYSVFFQDFNNNSDGREVIHYPVRPADAEAWVQSGGVPTVLEKCYIRSREVKTDAGEIQISEDERYLQMRLTESRQIGLRPHHTIDGEGLRFELVSQDNQEGIIYWELEQVPQVATATI